ncbi:MAG TPA: sporulation histidine kinase inhibitor Sda [Pseudogracilibacillus sp.]|nr:sporulation histidine kinase inhibitor Sda [Pseudogracilibacillus sp.]
MHKLPNDLLIETYIKAKQLNLPNDFIALIQTELIKRNIPF